MIGRFAGIPVASRLRMELLAATAFFTRYHVIHDQVYSIGRTLVPDRVNSPVIYFVDFTFGYVDAFFANREPDIVIRHDGYVNAMRMDQ